MTKKERLFERPVIQSFSGVKENKKEFTRGEKFKGSADRVNELISKGYLGGGKAVVDKAKEEESELSTLGMAELKAKADDAGLTVEGTGKGGAVKKEDYINALEK